MGSSALLERVCVALEALVAQGQPPELSEPQIAPQALNARPSHLNPADYTLSKGEKVSTGLNSREFRRSAEEVDHSREHASLGRFIASLPKADPNG
ncbi:hypothetical protein D3C76_1582630 [compost metagenome]